MDAEELLAEIVELGSDAEGWAESLPVLPEPLLALVIIGDAIHGLNRLAGGIALAVDDPDGEIGEAVSKIGWYACQLSASALSQR